VATGAVPDPVPPLRVKTADGRLLEVRHVVPSDLDAVRSLYERLTPDGVYRRFFTSVLPPPSYFERLVAIADRGGIGLLAFVDGELVGEVDVESLENGNGELAIVVDRRWRGWLGPYLVEMAAREAARRGIADLEAEILTCNRPMRAITRARGEAFLPTSDWQEARVVFPTSGSGPGWPRRDGTRVLVEQRGVAFDAVAGLAAAGFHVVACAGRTSGRPRCPVLDGADCPLASGAEVIVVSMPPGPDRQALLAAHSRGDVPVVVVEPSGVPLTAADLRAAVEAARPRSELDVGADLEHPVGREPEEA
jgi:hypothetical protein